jgi:hypothetical protein
MECFAYDGLGSAREVVYGAGDVLYGQRLGKDVVLLITPACAVWDTTGFSPGAPVWGGFTQP